MGFGRVSATSASWLRRPQQTRVRRWLFQAHLWIGLLLGVYIVVVSVSGSVAVFRREASIVFIPRSVEQVGDERLAENALRAALAAQLPGHDVVSIGQPRRAESLVYVTFERNGKPIERLVDPYTGLIVGDPYPPVVRVMEWTVKLHDELLVGDVGRKINGAAGLLVALLVLTGVAIWWPGTRRWPTGLIPRRGPSAPGWLWQLHAILGIWCAGLLFIWAVTGLYFGYPLIFEGLIDRFDPDMSDLQRPGEALLLDMIRLHFGRFGGLEIRIAWALLGLVPAVLFITGFTLWLRGRRRRGRRPALESALGEQRAQIDDGRMRA